MTGKITALRVQKRRTNRVSVFIDDEYAFSLQDVIAAQLRLGQELPQEQIRELHRRNAAETAYERVLHYLSYRPRSRCEVERYLQRKEVDATTIESVLQRLERAGLLDDEDFAQRWVDNRERLRPRGKWALRSELRRKGIASEVIDAALDNVDEEQNAMNAARRRYTRLVRHDEQTFRRRLLGFLQRRGFSYQTSQQVTDHFWQKACEEKGWLREQ